MPSAPGRSLVALVVVALGLAITPAAASAERRVVVLDIEGARTPRLQQAISGMVKARHEVIRPTNYREAARRMRAARLTPKDIKRVCSYLELDGVLEGSLVADAGRYRLTLRLRSGKTGAIAWKQGMWLNAPRLSDRMSRGLKARIGDAIAALPSMAGTARRTPAEAEDDEEFDEPAAPVAKRGGKSARPAAKDADDDGAGDEDFDDEVEDEAPRKPSKTRGKVVRKPRPAAADDEGDDEDDDEGDEGDEGDEADEGDEGDDGERRTAASDEGDDGDEGDDDDRDADAEVGAAGRGGRRSLTPASAAVSLSAGLSFTARKLTFVHNDQDPPPGYKGAMVPGLYVAAELYPMAFDGKARGVGSRLGVGVVLDRVIKLQSAVEDPAGGIVNLPTTQMKYGVDARYRHGFGKLTATLALGYSALGFKIDSSGAPDGVIVDVPNVNYKAVDGGLGLHYQAATKIALYSLTKVQLPLKTGQISSAGQYGQGTVLGIDLDAGLEYLITSQILVRAGGHFQRVGFKFDGVGAQSDRNGDGEVDVAGAADVYLGGQLTAGYLF